MIICEEFWDPSRENLSFGRVNCTSALDEKGRLFFAGRSSSDKSNAGEILQLGTNTPPSSSSAKGQLIPACPEDYTNTTSGSSMVVMLLGGGGGDSSSSSQNNNKAAATLQKRRNKILPNSNNSAEKIRIRSSQLYQIFRNNSNYCDDLYVGNISSLETLWSGLMNWLGFQKFWKRVNRMETCDAALTSDGKTCLYAVGGYLPNQDGSRSSHSVGSWLQSQLFQKEQVSVSRSVYKLNVVSTTNNNNNGRATTIPLSSWIPLASLPGQGIRDAAAVVVGNFLYVIGGRNNSGKALKSVHRLNLNNNNNRRRAVWESRSALPAVPRYGLAATVLIDRYIVVAGGYGNFYAKGRLKNVEYFDTITNEWFKLPDMPEGRMNSSLSVVTSNNRLLMLVVAGGTSGWGVIPMQSIITLKILEIMDIRDDDNADELEEQQQQQQIMNHNNPPPYSPSPAAVPIYSNIATIPTAPTVEELHWLTTNQSNPPPPSTKIPPTFQTSNDTMAYAAPPATNPDRNDRHHIIQPTAPTIEEPYLLTNESKKFLSSTPTFQTSSGDTIAYAAPSATNPNYPQSSQEDKSCVVCLDRPKRIAFLCGHQVCLECSPLLQECHSCRKPIKGRIQLYD